MLDIHTAAIYFDDNEREKIMNTWREKMDIPFKANIFCDHVTLAYRPTDALSAYVRPLPAGRKVNFLVTGWAADHNGQVMTGFLDIEDLYGDDKWSLDKEDAFKLFLMKRNWHAFLQGGEASDEEHEFHVTVSTANGIPPKYSNQLIEDSSKAGLLWVSGSVSQTNVIAQFTGKIAISYRTRSGNKNEPITD